MNASFGMASEAAFDNLLVAINGVSRRRIDEIVSLAYRGYGTGQLSDDQFSALHSAAHSRRQLFAARHRVQQRNPAAFKVKPPQHSRSRLREQRRTWGASGALPPALRALFTPGENAVAAIIRAEVRRHGSCSLTYAQIAKCAGLQSITVVKRFVREAKLKGLIAVKERRVAGAKNKPNVITIVSVEWKRWNELGSRDNSGGTTVPPHQNKNYNKSSNKSETRQTTEHSKRGSGGMGLGVGESGDSLPDSQHGGCGNG